MFKILIIIFICQFPGDGIANDNYSMRVGWVKTLKVLLQDIEHKNFNDLSLVEKSYLKKFQLIQAAYADGRFDCFYGGWPSKRGSNGKCGMPSRTNPEYSSKSCKEGEIQCQPLLFSKGLCVSFRTQAERNKTFSNCEKKFQSEKRGSYDFLKELSREDASSLRELSLLARDVCDDNSKAPQKGTYVCKKILEKLDDGLKSIDQVYTEAMVNGVRDYPDSEAANKIKTFPFENDLSKLGPLKIVSINSDVINTAAVSIESVEVEPKKFDHSDEDCEVTTHVHEKLKPLSDVVKEVRKISLDEMYEKIKNKFLKSPFCDPMMVLNDPNERPNLILISSLINDLDYIDYLGNRSGTKNEVLENLIYKYNLSPHLRDQVLPLMNQLEPIGHDEAINEKLLAKIKGLMVQDVVNNPSRRPADESIIRDGLAHKHIFEKNEAGESVCPFVGKDAFVKAMTGRDGVLAHHGKSISEPNLLTIVDYTKPSNQRRLFVLDLNSEEVIHNTWVAHGLGGGSSSGVDGFGSSPKMSNVIGSNMSSDGFILATRKHRGDKYGNNLLLQGIDSKNSNIAKRDIFLHGWEYRPGKSYIDGYETDGKKVDVVNSLKNLDVKSSSMEKVQNALKLLRRATVIDNYIYPTEGCLGVPDTNARYLDRKGRNTSQLEMLRDDLPGSIIFNYSGPQMKSNFF